jgi:hypothetical protein
VCRHCDAAFERDSSGKTQAGFVVGFCEDKISRGEETLWSPALWRSGKIRRACSSTLAAESQAALDAIRHQEWVAILLGEALFREFSVEDREQWMPALVSPLMTDCKSLFDLTNTALGTSSQQDKTAAIDVVVLRDHMSRLSIPMRWCPSERQLADSMTKNTADAADLLRSVMKSGRYVLALEETVLAGKAQERKDRLEKGKAKAMSTSPSTSRGGLRDYYLPEDTKHYMKKIAEAQVVDSDEIFKIKMHQVDRTWTMRRGEIREDLRAQARDSVLTFYRVKTGGKLGQMQHRWTKLSVPEQLEEEWVGASVLMRREVE